MKSILLSLTILVFQTISFGQVPNIDRIKKKTEKKLENKVDEKTDEVLDGDKKKKGKKDKEEEKAIDNHSNSSTNTTNSDTNKTGTNSHENKSTNSSMPPANNPTTIKLQKKTKLTYRTANAIFPNEEFYRENIGKVLLLESSKRENEERTIAERIKNEIPVNGAMSFYIALPTTPHDFPVYPNGDTLKDGFEMSSSNIKLIFKVKNSPLTFTYFNEYPIKLGDVEAELEMCDYYGSNVVGDQRDYADYNDLRDSIPQIKSDKWKLFLESLPYGKNDIEVSAWISYMSSMDEAFYPVSVAAGEFSINKTTENANIDYYSRFRDLVLKRRFREAKSLLIKDEGITSEIHKNNIGKIVFSKGSISKASENNSTLINEFSGEDLIYGRLYLDQTLSNIITREKYDTLRYAVGERLFGRIYIDGKLIDKRGSDTIDTQDDIYGWEIHFPDLTEENNTFTTHEVGILPDRSTTIMDDYHPCLPYFLNALAPGLHTVKIEAYGTLSNTIYSTGEFNYTKVSGTQIKYGYDLSKIGCKKGLDNDGLEGQIKKAYLEDEDYSFYRENYTFVSVIICDREWNVNRNAFGTIQFRSIEFDLLIKDKFGNHRLLHSVSAIQDYNGSGYGIMYLGGRVSDYYVVPGK